MEQKQLGLQQITSNICTFTQTQHFMGIKQITDAKPNKMFQPKKKTIDNIHVCERFIRSNVGRFYASKVFKQFICEDLFEWQRERELKSPKKKMKQNRTHLDGKPKIFTANKKTTVKQDEEIWWKWATKDIFMLIILYVLYVFMDWIDCWFSCWSNFLASPCMYIYYPIA